MNSITKRWAKGNLLITVIVLLSIEAVFVWFVYTSYNSDAKQAIVARMNNIIGQISVNKDLSAAERSIALRRMAEEFSEKNKFEFMLINSSGNVVTSSAGFMADHKVNMPDFNAAIQGKAGYGEFLGKTEQGESILAVSMLLPYSTRNIAAMRMVVSMSLVNEAISTNVLLSLIVMLAIILFSVFTGLFFVKSIVNPIATIEKTAKIIASGDFSVRIKNSYNDEIGNLCDTINDMASELSKTDEMKNSFISSVSHELRTPLTSIKGWVETLDSVKDTDKASYQKGIEIIRSETERLYNMVEELLDFSNVQKNGIMLKNEVIDLVAELSDAILMSAQSAKAEQLSIVFEEPELICPINGDKNRLRQVFLNILDNAIKYSNKGDSIIVTLKTICDKVIISVQDFGAGVSEADLYHIKERFYKGENSRKGSGIGLAVVDEIIKAHEGYFSIESKLNVGTTVTIELNLYNSKT